MLKTPEGINNYTYIVRCADGSLYTGWTNDLVNRLTSHNSGKGAKYTSSRFPVELVYYEVSETREEAMSREWHIKRLSRKDKEKLSGLSLTNTRVCIYDIAALENEELFAYELHNVSEARRIKIEGFRRSEDKRRSLGAGLALRQTLAQAGMNVDKLIIETDPDGKPYIVNADNVYFNLSHSGNRVMCIVSNRPVGCDVEMVKAVPAGVAARFFSEEENIILAEFCVSEQNEPQASVKSLAKEPQASTTSLAKEPQASTTSPAEEPQASVKSLAKEPQASTTSLAKEPQASTTSPAEEPQTSGKSLANEAQASVKSLANEAQASTPSPTEKSSIKSTACLIEDALRYQDMFYRMWTLKESFLKCTGKGLGYPMKDFSVIPDTDVRECGKQPLTDKTCCAVNNINVIYSSVMTTSKKPDLNHEIEAKVKPAELKQNYDDRNYQLVEIMIDEDYRYSFCIVGNNKPEIILKFQAEEV